MGRKPVEHFQQKSNNAIQNFKKVIPAAIWRKDYKNNEKIQQDQLGSIWSDPGEMI